MSNRIQMNLTDTGVMKLFDNPNHPKCENFEMLPFTTSETSGELNEFNGVIGAFSRLLSGKDTKLEYKINDFYNNLKLLLENNNPKDIDKIIDIIKLTYINNEVISPFNISAFNYYISDNLSRKVAEFLFSIFIDEELVNKYEKIYKDEKIDVLQKLTINALPSLKEKSASIKQYYNLLPVVSDVFKEDMNYLLSNAKIYEKDIKRFLEYYFMFYVTQLSVKLSKFDEAELNKVEKIYMCLSWEVLSAKRKPYIYGWNYVQKDVAKLFYHALTLEFLSYNNSPKALDYIGFKEAFENSPYDTEMANEVFSIINEYRNWTNNINYENLSTNYEKKYSETSRAIRILFDTIYYQFQNRKNSNPDKKYPLKFKNFVEQKFCKRRGRLGNVFNITENDIILFTQIILAQNLGRIRLVRLYDEFERRGLIFDDESKKKIVELFEKLNLLEKKSDSGDAQYVKSIL